MKRVWFGFGFGFIWVLFGLVWFDLVWFGLVWFGLVWFGLIWFGFAYLPLRTRWIFLRLSRSESTLLKRENSRSVFAALTLVPPVPLRSRRNWSAPSPATEFTLGTECSRSCSWPGRGGRTENPEPGGSGLAWFGCCQNDCGSDLSFIGRGSTKAIQIKSNKMISRVIFG